MKSGSIKPTRLHGTAFWGMCKDFGPYTFLGLTSRLFMTVQSIYYHCVIEAVFIYISLNEMLGDAAFHKRTIHG